MSENSSIAAVTDGEFDQVVAATKGVVLVDFWATWCGPCRTLSKTIDALAQDYDGKVKVLKMDVDANPQTPSRFRIRGVPTMILFKDGQMVDQLVGAQPRDVIEGALRKQGAI